MSDGWTQGHTEAYVEACRVVPAILAAKTRDAQDDARLLLAHFHDHAAQLELCRCDAWTALFTAALHWFSNVSGVLARETGEDPQEMFQEMTRAAALWEATRV